MSASERLRALGDETVGARALLGVPLPLIADVVEAAEAYAAATHWAVLRDDGQPVMCWIGPGAEELPIPNPTKVARDALTALREHLERGDVT